MLDGGEYSQIKHIVDNKADSKHIDDVMYKVTSF